MYLVFVISCDAKAIFEVAERYIDSTTQVFENSDIKKKMLIFISLNTHGNKCGIQIDKISDVERDIISLMWHTIW